MSDARILAPDGWIPPRGYTHGVVATGRIVFLAGQIGWDASTGEFATDDFVGQVEQALRNIVTLVTAADAQTAHIVRLTWYITDRATYVEKRREIGQAYREVMGSHYPPMSVVVVAALVEDRAKVEIEATAVIPE